MINNCVKWLMVAGLTAGFAGALQAKDPFVEVCRLLEIRDLNRNVPELRHDSLLHRATMIGPDATPETPRGQPSLLQRYGKSGSRLDGATGASLLRAREPDLLHELAPARDLLVEEAP